MIVRTLLLIAFGTAALGPAAAIGPRERDRDQQEAWRATREGRFMPLREIEARVVPNMRGSQYLGPELDPGSGRYRLKFMRGPRVIWIDVDARTGAIIGRSGD